MNTKLSDKADIGSNTRFAGVYLAEEDGGGLEVPYIYTTDNNINFRYSEANNTVQYTDMRTIMSKCNRSIPTFTLNGTTLTITT